MKLRHRQASSALVECQVAIEGHVRRAAFCPKSHQFVFGLSAIIRSDSAASHRIHVPYRLCQYVTTGQPDTWPASAWEICYMGDLLKDKLNSELYNTIIAIH